MPNSPEAEHLQRAVDAVRDALLPEKKKEPIREPVVTEPDRETVEEPGQE